MPNRVHVGDDARAAARTQADQRAPLQSSLLAGAQPDQDVGACLGSRRLHGLHAENMDPEDSRARLLLGRNLHDQARLRGGTHRGLPRAATGAIAAGTHATFRRDASNA